MDQLSETFGALADPTRRAILARLALGETSVTELAEPFAMSMPAVSRHLKVLEKAGLIARGREAQWRPCRLRPEAMREANAWLEQYRRFWEESFDRLEEYLEVMKAKSASQQVSEAASQRKADAVDLSAAEATAEEIAEAEWRRRKDEKKRRKKELRKAEKKLKKEAKKAKHQHELEAQGARAPQKAKKTETHKEKKATGEGQ